MLDIKPIALKSASKDKTSAKVILIEKGSNGVKLGFTKWESDEIKKAADNGCLSIFKNEKETKIIVQIEKLSSKIISKSKEECRRMGVTILGEVKKNQITSICLSTELAEPRLLLNIAEGVILGNYQFLTYKTDKKANTLKQVLVDNKKISQAELDELSEVMTGVYHARTLVNEPVVTLTAERLSEEIKKLGKAAKFDVKVLDKKAIKKEKMGGLLAVNLGSKLPPTFTILEYKPKKVKNKKPIIFVGKGVVYDTGGLSLKPTLGSMDSMKSDMAGAAAVVGAIYAAAKNKLPIHVIGLIPATDNRPGEDAITPGDVITHRGGKTSEILNTDAEGRLILADALDYAKQYKPELVFDLATLTGAQVMAIGQYAAAIMGTANQAVKNKLVEVGFDTHERVAEMPFWEDYGELIKSDIADIKNVGGREGGCITAGKYLEHFVDYPWIHIDIAGPSFLGSAEHYKPKGGTGYGVRLLYEFLKTKI
jgi:leucyl aminopeptidase